MSRHRQPPRHDDPAAAGPSQRQLRVAESIRHILAELFARAPFRDPELARAHITITEVRTSPDLRHAHVYVAPLGGGDAQALVAALERAKAFLRGEVAHAMRLKFAPDLHFLAETAIDHAAHIDALLHRPDVARDLAKPPAPAPARRPRARRRPADTEN
ncbi:MAG: 30S ribosome-binding factor RbfA [Alphaproteobacteria bacterium]|nr:30S ribosome-binding factor RbfA [Alphaproteobacteria bacterium]